MYQSKKSLREQIKQLMLSCEKLRAECNALKEEAIQPGGVLKVWLVFLVVK